MSPLSLEPLRVLYDGSMLGEGMHDVRHRTGIHRVVEQLGMALAARTDVELALSATVSWRTLLDLDAYVRSQPAFRSCAVVRSGNGGAIGERWTDRARALLEQPERTSRVRRRAMQLIDRGLTRMAPTLRPADTDAFDVFHAPAHLLPPVSARARRTTYFITIHDLIPEILPEFGSPRLRRRFRRARQSIGPADFVIAVSEATRRDVAERWQIEPERIFVAHTAASPELFHPVRDPGRIAQVRARYGIPEGEYVLSVNALDPRKNVALAIRSFIRLIREERIADLHLVLVWNREWDPRTLFEGAEDIALARERIVVTGFVDDADLAAIYSGASFFVLPTFYEGFGLPVLEAMQCGVPVLTSNTSSLPEVVGDAGLLVDPRAADDFADAMLRLHRDGALRQRLAEAGLARARRFTWERTAAQVVAAYRAGAAAR